MLSVDCSSELLNIFVKTPTAMRTVYLILTLICFTAFSSHAAKYKLDEASISKAFETSVDITQQIGIINRNLGFDSPSSTKMDDPSNKQTIAAIIAFAEWFLGIGVLIPIHRLFLGCDGKEIKVVALYCITLGGCGLLPIIDGIALLVDDSKSRYIDNPKYLMWIN
jgi:hypothetical protein